MVLALIFRRLVALALLGHDMDQHRAILVKFANVLQDGQQMFQVMAVDRPDIEEAHLLEQGAAGDHAAGIFLGPFGDGLDAAREAVRQVLGEMTQRDIGLRRDQPRQIGAHGTDRRGDRHVVVVEDHDQPAVH